VVNVHGFRFLIIGHNAVSEISNMFERVLSKLSANLCERKANIVPDISESHRSALPVRTLKSTSCMIMKDGNFLVLSNQ
jgi:hypothetical protein